MIINNKRIWLGLFIGIVMSFSVYGQNINAEKITVPDSKLTNLYQIDSGVYRSEQPSDADFKALEKYGIREVLNLRNRHSDDDEAAGTKIKLYRLKMKAHSVSEDQLINALRIIKNRKGGPEHKVALLDVHEPGDGRPVEADTLGKGAGQLTGKKRNVFLVAENIAECQFCELNIVVLNKIENVLCGAFHRNLL